MNDLDRAIMAMCRSRSAMPDLFRELSKGELYFLMKYHPEIEEGDQMELRNGVPMPFIMLDEHAEEGGIVLLFSSQERANEALENSDGTLPDRTATGSMESKKLLDVLGKSKLRAILNMRCSTGDMMLPTALMCDLASGKVMELLGPDEGLDCAEVAPIEPANYPTDLVQGSFEILKKHRQFRAAWIFELLATTLGGGTFYKLEVLMEPFDETIFHDLELVAEATCNNKVNEVYVALIKPDKVPALLQEAPPFFVAPDFALTGGQLE